MRLEVQSNNTYTININHLCFHFTGCLPGEPRLAGSAVLSSFTSLIPVQKLCEWMALVFMGWTPFLSPNQKCQGRNSKHRLRPGKITQWPRIFL